MYKTILLASAMMLAIPAIAGAQTATGTGTGVAVSGSTSGAVAQGGGAIVTFNNPGQINSNQNVRYRSSGSLKTTPNAIAPGLGSAAIETCYGPGVSGGVSVTGFGASFGAGQYDTSCNRRLNARTIFAMGYKEQAMRMMMNEPEVAQAFGYNQPVAVQRAPAVVYEPASIRGPAGSGCTKWTGGSPGAGVCVY